MKKLVKAFVCSHIMMFSLIPAVSVQAKEVTPSYKIEYQDADSMQSVFSKELHTKYANVKFKKKTKNVSVYESKNYQVKVKNLDVNQIGKQKVEMTATDKKANVKTNAKVTVKVQDTTAPVIDAADSISIEQGDTLNIQNYVSTNEEAKIELTSSVDTSGAGTYNTTIQATDTSGNVSTKDVTVNVEKGFYQKIADAAIAQIGVNQDCTMLVTNSLKAVGIDFHGAPSAYLSLGDLTNNPVPGDICVYQGHVAIYIGNGRAIHGGWNGGTTAEYSVSCSTPFIGYVHVRR